MTKTPPSNFERMLALIDEVFATRSDPDQLQVDETVIEKLQAIHPATLGEYNEGDGPCVWVLVIPTTKEVMNDFLAGRITEQQLLDRTEPGQQFEALYLCSATVLPEYRRRGLALRLCTEAVNAISAQHPVKTLYVWPFTPEGKMLAERVAQTTGLELRT
jgi:ribosomal protein S18 acetylase RimI-like enzyme